MEEFICTEDIKISWPFYSKTIKYYGININANDVLMIRMHFLVHKVQYDKHKKVLYVTIHNGHAYGLVLSILLMFLALILAEWVLYNLYPPYKLLAGILKLIIPAYQFYTAGLIFSLIFYTNLFPNRFIIQRGTVILNLT